MKDDQYEVREEKVIPVWRRFTMTIEEAAGYYHIGESKLRSLVEMHPNGGFL